MKIHTSNIVRHVSLGTVMVLCLSASSALQVAQAKDAPNHGQLSERDYKFVTEAVHGGAMEVSLGQIAVQKASDPSVHDFGQRMVTDHQKANDELTQLVSQKGATLPDTSNKKEERITEHLQGLAGADFDRAYIKDMVRDHKKNVKEFQREADDADDADLKNWVIKTLPTLQEHLRMAESAETTVMSEKTVTKTP